MIVCNRMRLILLTFCMLWSVQMQAHKIAGVGKLVTNSVATLCMALFTSGMGIGTVAKIQESIEASKMSLGEKFGATVMWSVLGGALTVGCGLGTRYFYRGMQDALTILRADPTEKMDCA